MSGLFDHSYIQQVVNFVLNNMLVLKGTLEEGDSGRRKRHRDIFWYNPPFSKNVATNLGQSFLKILGKEFPKGHALHKVFNRNTVKIKYSCMPVCTSNEIDCGQKSQHNIHRICAPQFQKSKVTVPNKLHSHTNITANDGF